MKKLIVIDEDGNQSEFDNVLSWGCLCKEDIETVEELLSLNGEDVKLTDEEILEVERRLEKRDSLADMEDLRWIVQDVIDDRRFEN